MPKRPKARRPRPWSFPRGRTFTLDNGLRVILHDLPGQYVVSAGLMLDVPLSSEPAGLEGVSLLTASTLGEGTVSHPGTSFAEAVEACGAVLDTTVGYSHVHALVDVPGAHLRTAISLLAEAVMEPQLLDADVEHKYIGCGHNGCYYWESTGKTVPKKLQYSSGVQPDRRGILELFVHPHERAAAAQHRPAGHRPVQERHPHHR